MRKFIQFLAIALMMSVLSLNIKVKGAPPDEIGDGDPVYEYNLYLYSSMNGSTYFETIPISKSDICTIDIWNITDPVTNKTVTSWAVYENPELSGVPTIITSEDTYPMTSMSDYYLVASAWEKTPQVVRFLEWKPVVDEYLTITEIELSSLTTFPEEFQFDDFIVTDFCLKLKDGLDIATCDLNSSLTISELNTYATLNDTKEVIEVFVFAIYNKPLNMKTSDGKELKTFIPGIYKTYESFYTELARAELDYETYMILKVVASVDTNQVVLDVNMDDFNTWVTQVKNSFSYSYFSCNYNAYVLEVLNGYLQCEGLSIPHTNINIHIGTIVKLFSYDEIDFDNYQTQLDLPVSCSFATEDGLFYVDIEAIRESEPYLIELYSLKLLCLFCFTQINLSFNDLYVKPVKALGVVSINSNGKNLYTFEELKTLEIALEPCQAIGEIVVDEVEYPSLDAFQAFLTEQENTEHVYSVNYITVASHTYVYHEAVAPTCTTQGHLAYTECTVCGLGSEVPILETIDHGYGEWIIEQEATCISNGVKVHTCTMCGHAEQEVTPKTVHQIGDFVVEKEATCSSLGLKVKTCEVCGEIIESVVIPKESHFLGDSKIYKNVSSFLTLDTIKSILTKDVKSCSCEKTISIKDKTYLGYGNIVGTYEVILTINDENIIITIEVVSDIHSDYIYKNTISFTNKLSAEQIVSDMKKVALLPNVNVTTTFSAQNDTSKTYFEETATPGTYSYQVSYLATSGESGTSNINLEYLTPIEKTTEDEEKTNWKEYILPIVVVVTIIFVLYLIFGKKKRR